MGGFNAQIVLAEQLAGGTVAAAAVGQGLFNHMCEPLPTLEAAPTQDSNVGLASNSCSRTKQSIVQDRYVLSPACRPRAQGRRWAEDGLAGGREARAGNGNSSPSASLPSPRALVLHWVTHALTLALSSNVF